VNARPHIGFAMELIQADVLARYHRLQGDEVFFLTGTDEHGMKIAQTAKEHGMEPKKLVDQNAAYFHALRDVLTLSNDAFIRTTDVRHIAGAQELWQQMEQSGDIYKNSYEGLYCIGCEAFITEKDLVDGKCPNHNRVPEKLNEDNYFFRLSKYSQEIKKRIEKDELRIVPQSRKHEILAVLSEGLKDISFSRPRSALKWGIEVPGDPKQVMYVWCDALSNYMTAIGYGQQKDDEKKQFAKFWPADVHVIGKDILRFHAGIWIGMLLSAKLPIPKKIYVHGFITSEGKKMSKSLSNVVDPVEAVKAFGVDALRYYLLREIPTTDDGDFSQERFRIVYESELANTIGNLVSRVLAMTHKYFGGKVPQTQADMSSFAKQQEELWQAFDEAIADFDLKKALEAVIAFANFANQYVENQKPWVLARDDQQKLAVVIYALLEMIRQIGLLLLIFMPTAAQKILDSLGCPAEIFYKDVRRWGLLKSGQELKKPVPLFPRIES